MLKLFRGKSNPLTPLTALGSLMLSTPLQGFVREYDEVSPHSRIEYSKHLLWKALFLG
jgi:hypothetical protein